MALKYRESALTEQGIETVLAELKAYLRTLNMEDGKTLNLCLTAKELLKHIMKASGQGTKVSVGLGRHFGGPFGL